MAPRDRIVTLPERGDVRVPTDLNDDRWSIDAVIDALAIRTVFQPVVHLASHSWVGFEALTRGPPGSSLEAPLSLLDAARQAGRLGELDWLCRIHAMEAAAAARMPDTVSWLFNVELAGLAIDCPARFRSALIRARSELRVILEIVQRDVDGNVLDLIRATDGARHDAWGIALDDVGAEEESLALLPLLRPDMVKLDMTLVGVAPHAEAMAITAAVRSYAELHGAVILAEGIETEQHEQQARVFGATYGQGYFYGRPGPLPSSVLTPTFPIPIRQHPSPLDGQTPFELLSAEIEPQRAQKQQLVHISTHLETQSKEDGQASVLLAGFQKKEFFTGAARERYRQLAKSNALTVVVAEGVHRIDEPAYHVGPIPSDSRLGAEWMVIVVNPNRAAAFVAHDCGDTGPDEQRRFDFIYTHDRGAVIDAARCFIHDLTDQVRVGSMPVEPRNHVGALIGDVNRPHRVEPCIPHRGPVRNIDGTGGHFRAASQVVLDYLNTTMPMAFWSITRVENDRQTYLYLDDNDYGLMVGGSHAWQDSYCIHMVAGEAPRIAPDAAAIPLYAAARVNDAVQIGAYAGAPIAEPDGTLFGAICGLDRTARLDLLPFGPTLNALSELLTLALAGDRVLRDALEDSAKALTYASTDALTGIHNRHAWDDTMAELEIEFATYADPTVIVVIDLDNLKQTNDGPGGHQAGDHLLRSAAHVMERHIRDSDFLARIGGDEFGIILTQYGATLARTLDRLERALDRAAIPASLGWAGLRLDGTVYRAFELADHAMYEAKQKRKSVIHAGRQQHVPTGVNLA
jgi:diguanylate cyclase (GGDEF)-like protein